MNSTTTDFHIIAGFNDPVDNIENFTSTNSKIKLLNNLNLKIGSNTFTWQLNLLKNILIKKPDAIILFGVNPLLLSSLFSFIFLKYFTNVKVYWWGHGTLGHQGKFGKNFRLFFYKHSDGIILYDSRQKAKLDALLPTVPKFVVGNALNDEDYGFNIHKFAHKRKEALSKKGKKIRLIFAGRITKRKKLDILIKTVHYLKNDLKKNVSVKIIGDGPEIDKLRSMTQRKKLNKEVIFLGALYGQEAHHHFIDSDLFILPDALGLSILHANSFGLPLITSDAMANHGPELEYIREGINGGFYKHEDHISLAQEIIHWNAKIEKEGLTLIDKLLELSKFHTPQQMVQKFEKLFNQLN